MSEFAEFNTEMNRLSAIEWKGYTRTLAEVGVDYLGAVAQSAKLRHSYYHNVSTYGIYLSPSDSSGFNICPNSEYCRDNCLNGSGQNKVARMAHNDNIDRARIVKTRLFFANREVFMRLMIHEIKREIGRAKVIGNFFSIRMNCTSDISPLAFTLNGKNILEIFVDISFYDYTKVESRLALMSRFPNYDITWSIDGSKENREIGLKFLEKGGRVAIVYGTEEMPKTWFGYECGNGDETDYRPSDIAPVCALKFKKTANNYKDGKFVMPNIDFIIQEGDKNTTW